MIDKIIKFAPQMLAPFAIAYLICMFIYPLTQGNWDHIQAVWDRWQSLNVGVLAFVASVIAFYISHYRMNKQRERDFIAARAFLPEALSSLCTHLRSHKTLLIEALEKVNQNDKTALSPDKIEPPAADYKEVFSKCIALAPEEIGNHLANILTKLQIHNSRVRSLQKSFNEQSQTVVTNRDMLSHLYDTAELYALIDILFNIARGIAEFKLSKISPDKMTDAYLNLDIDPTLIAGLQQYTIKRLGGM